MRGTEYIGAEVEEYVIINIKRGLIIHEVSTKTSEERLFDDGDLAFPYKYRLRFLPKEIADKLESANINVWLPIQFNIIGENE